MNLSKVVQEYSLKKFTGMPISKKRNESPRAQGRSNVVTETFGEGESEGFLSHQVLIMAGVKLMWRCCRYLRNVVSLY